jgi:hypothetical protein
MAPADVHSDEPDQGADLGIELPPVPLPLNPGASRVLLRVLLKAARAQAESPVHLETDADALAS